MVDIGLTAAGLNVGIMTVDKSLTNLSRAQVINQTAKTTVQTSIGTISPVVNFNGAN